MFTKANGIIDLYRWLPWVSRRIAFDRPNHGDPFETPTSPLVRVRIVTRPRARAGDDRRSDRGQRRRPGPDVQGQQRARLHGHRGHRLPDRRRAIVGRDDRAGLVPAGRPRRGDARCRGGRLRRRSSAARAPIRTRTSRSSSRPAATAWNRPGSIWIPTGQSSANLRYLAAHETAHQWFYGIVGNDQAREPFTDEAAADFVARYILGLQAREPLLDRPARPVDLPVLGDLLLRDGSTSRAATCSTRPAGGWDRPPSGRRCAATSRHIGMRSHRRRRCSTRSTRRPRSTSPTRCSRRASRGCY